jgi:hypothetical protein
MISVYKSVNAAVIAEEPIGWHILDYRVPQDDVGQGCVPNLLHY